jgi:hypothetical protein
MQYDVNGYYNFIIVLSLSILLMMNFVSGSEAMFADLCYFPVRSVQVKKEEIQLLDHISYMFPLICNSDS